MPQFMTCNEQPTLLVIDVVEMDLSSMNEIIYFGCVIYVDV